MELKDVWKFILALFGFGGVAMLATSAWAVPQSGVYTQLLPAPQWLYAGDIAQCVWEVHPNTTKTINSVSYGVPGNWTACVQNASDWLLWTCSNVTVAEGSVACQGIRVVQNENPGTSETTDNESMIFKTASVKGARFPGCTSADCVITSGASIPNGTYMMRNLKINAALTLQGNTTIIATENFTIGSTGSLSITAATPSYKLNISAYRFLNQGAISGLGSTGGAPGYSCGGGGCSGGSAGGPGAKIYISSAYVTNTGTIGINGGVGGGASGTCVGCAEGGCTIMCGPFAGGDGGLLIIDNSTTPTVNNTGTISGTGGRGGDGGACCSCGAVATNGGNGGAGGNFSYNTLNFSSSGTITFNGGDGGNGAQSNCCCGLGSACSNGGNAGSSSNKKIDVYSNISVTQTIASVAGTPGAAGNGAPWYTCSAGTAGTTGSMNVSYCANGTGMDWTKFTPTATTAALSCRSKPVVSFTVPNVSSNFTAYKQNISVNVAQAANITLVISYSKNNGSTWEWLSPDFYTIPYNGSNNGTPYFDTHRQGSDYANYSWMRVIAYNNSSSIYSDPAYINFNLTDMATTLTGTAVPNGSISTNTIRFTCNYTNTTSQIEAATPYIYLDSTPHNMSFNNTALTYYWDNDRVLSAGTHSWYCALDKANYRNATSANTSFNITGFGILYPAGQTDVKLACPFPTISGMTPAGQKAGIGIFRIQNYNTTAKHNYTLFLNNTPPSGISLYARCDRFSPNIANWTTLSTTVGYKGLLNINSTNSSAYCWLRMDCASASPGTYTPFDFVFTEE